MWTVLGFFSAIIGLIMCQFVPEEPSLIGNIAGGMFGIGGIIFLLGFYGEWTKQN